MKNTTPPNKVQQQNNPYNFVTLVDSGGGSLLSYCRLENGNGVFYPETEYDTDFKMRTYNDLMSYAMRKNANANFSVNAIVLYEEKVVADKVGNELVIV